MYALRNSVLLSVEDLSVKQLLENVQTFLAEAQCNCKTSAFTS